MTSPVKTLLGVSRGSVYVAAKYQAYPITGGNALIAFTNNCSPSGVRK